MKKIWLVTFILLIFSTALVAQPQSVGEIVDLKGEVFINHKPAEIGMEIYEKDTVGTQKGETEIVFEKGRIYLGEYTQVRVANLYPLEIEVWHGEILTLFLEPVEIITPHQKFSLEGTWRVVVDPYQTQKYKLTEETEEYTKEEHHYYYYYPLRIGWWYPWGVWFRVGWYWNWWHWHPYWSYWSYRWYRYGYYRGYRYGHYSNSRISKNQLRQRRYSRNKFLSSISRRQLREKIRSYSSLKAKILSFRKRSLSNSKLRTLTNRTLTNRFKSKTSLRSSRFQSSRSPFRINKKSSRTSFRSPKSYSRIKSSSRSLRIRSSRSTIRK